ncbi:putative T7SS-secreted protein [Nocardia sp. NPDC005366]|uniref:putative T7SS-secreted protein n=1 Tax=Nocardia sp. NPDC005366 TaxID=3156878 RepID=UPI0033AA3FDB
MGIGDFVNNLGDKIEKGIESAAQTAGELADSALDKAADVAHGIGADSVGEALDDLGDQIVDATGGELKERELGESDDPKELVRGEPSRINEVAEHVGKIGTSIEQTGDALRKIDVADWSGSAASTFHDEFAEQPKLWWDGADAMTKAKTALGNWFHEVTAAQAKASEAITKWNEADTEERNRKNEWNARSEEDRKGKNLSDTWTALRDQARAILRDARTSRDNAATTAAAAIAAATETAPTEPPFLSRWGSNFEDATNALEQAKLNFTSGLLTSLTGMVQFVRSISILDTYNLTHPAEYLSSMSDMGTGLVIAAADPKATASAMLSGFRTNPSEALGALTGDVLTTVATGGAGSAKLGVSAVDKVGDASKVARAGRSVVEDAGSAGAKHTPTTNPANTAASKTGEAAPKGDATPNSTTPATKLADSSPQPNNPTSTEPTGAGSRSPETSPSAHGGDPATPNSAAPDTSPQTSGNSASAADSGGHTGTTEPSPGRPEGALESSGSGTSQADSSPTRHDDGSGHLTEDTPARPTSDDPPAATRSDPDAPAPAAATPEPHTPQHSDSTPGSPDPDHGGSSPEHNSSTPEHETPADNNNGHDPNRDPDDPATTPGTGEHSPNDHHDPGSTDDQVARNDVDHGEDGRGSVGDEATNNPPEHNATDGQTDKTGDPVATATGEFLLPLTDITLPGVLPLKLKRGHRSNYRFGRWFGPSWSSTLDMRVVVEHSCATVVFDDGMLLPYPHAEVGVGVEPVTGGQRWKLTRTEIGGYRLWDPTRELVWHFVPEPILDGLDTRLGNYAISAITDRHHNRIRFHYNHTGAPTEITHSGGYRILLDTDAGRITAMTVLGDTDAAPSRTVIRRFGYTDGDLTEVVNGIGGKIRFTYDDHHRMTSWIDSNRSSVVNTYDDHGRVIHQRGTDGVFNADFDYLDYPDGTGRLTTVTDSRGATTAYGFDQDLRLRDIAAPDGGRRRLTYNSDRRPLTVTEPDGATTRYRYTPDGDVATITRPDGAVISIDYAYANRPATVTNADGTTRHQSWDKTGNLVATVDEAGARTEYDHHPCGAISEVRTDDGARTVIEVDPAGLPVTVTDAYGATTRIQRDPFGRPATVTDPLGAITRYEWTPEGKPARRIDPDRHHESWTYDGENNLLTHTNRAGLLTRYTYGGHDKVAARTDPDGSVHRYFYNTERQLTAVINPLGQRWTYEYDLTGRLIAETDYTGATTRYTHHRTGRIATVTPATGITRHHRYDILCNLTSITADSGEYLTYTHDPAGRILTAVNGTDETITHTIEFTYTPTGRVATQKLDDQPALINEYDTRGRRTRRTAPSGAITTWRHDILGRTSSLSNGGHTVNFTHDRSGRLVRWQVGEVQIDRILTSTGELEGQEVTGFPATGLTLDFGDGPPRPAPFRIRRDDYTYRPDNFLATHTTQQRDTAEAHTVYSLDPVGRINAITCDSTLVEAYEYDGLSNITAGLAERGDNLTGSSTPAQLESREYHDNLLVRDGRNHYSYDPAGRLIRKTATRDAHKPEVWHYRYNAFDQLTDIYTPDGQWWQYTHDALGRRVSKSRIRSDDTHPYIAAEFFWDGTKLLAEYSHDFARTTQWIYRPRTFTPILQTHTSRGRTPTALAVLESRPGALSDLIEPATCTVLGHSRTNTWGQTSWHGNKSTPMRLPGQYYDEESGYHYNLFRTYDPTSGRYLTLDPLGLIPAANPNAYPRNPSRWADPLGLNPDAYSGNTNGGSWDPEEEPYLYRGVPHQTPLDPEEFQRMHQNALDGIAEPLGGSHTAEQHAGGSTESPYTSWTTDYEGGALDAAAERPGPGVVMRIPNADGPGYQRVGGITYPYPEGEVTILGRVTGADVSVDHGPWRSTR